jgi:hypothetical protein
MARVVVFGQEINQFVHAPQISKVLIAPFLLVVHLLATVMEMEFAFSIKPLLLFIVPALRDGQDLIVHLDPLFHIHQKQTLNLEEHGSL